MKKNLLLLLCLFCLVNVCHAKAKDTFTVFQLNLWHGCTKVPNGDQGIIDGIGSVDPFEFVTEKSDESYEYSIGYNQ